MAHAAMRAGREPGEVKLIAVTKTMKAERVREAYEAGLRAFGESRVQEAAGKIAALGLQGVEWHLVGHLQKNKAKEAVRLFDLIHSVDSLDLMAALDRHAGAGGKVQRVLVEVKLSPEETKFGIDEQDLAALLEAAKRFDNIRVEGLMTIPPYSENPEESRPYFRRLRELAEAYGLKELSMGMTGDFEVAIEEGATMVRIGTAIFGERGQA